MSGAVKLAIHGSKGFFTDRWTNYCQRKGINYTIVNCYNSDIVSQLKNFDIFLWHHHQGNAKDILFAKQLLFALEHAGVLVFPDFKTNWHFDDKVGQKYLFEALGVESFIPSWVFYTKSDAMSWARSASYPKVMKLRGGAGSQNVNLIRTEAQAFRMIKKAFGKGFKSYDAWGSLFERFRKYRLGKVGAFEVVKGIARLFVAPPYARVRGNESGYIYFQEFLPDNSFDVRVIVIDGKAFALKRFVRQNDFRASGSGHFSYAKEEFDERCIALAFELTRSIQAQCAAYDFVFDEVHQPRVIEISYGFYPEGYDDCPGYWDESLRWFAGKFDPYGWIIDRLIQQYQERKKVKHAF